MNKEILVLGPTGNVGSRLTQLLVESGADVRTGNRQDFDFFRPETYGPLFKGISELFLLTPLVPQMVELTAEILQAAKRSQIRKIVRLSALGSDKNSSSSIFRWHAECEGLIEESGIAYTILRPNAFMQNFAKYYSPMIKARGALFLPANGARVSFVNAKDVAAVAQRCLSEKEHDGAILDLTGQEALSFQEAASLIGHVMNRPISYSSISQEIAREAMIENGTPSWRADILLGLYRHYRAGEAEMISQAIEKVLGRQPSTFKDFIVEHRRDFT